MHWKRLPLLFLALLAVVLLTAPADPPIGPASTETEQALMAAFSRRLDSAPEAQPLTFDLFTPELDTAFVTPGGDLAVLWMALRDDHGRRLATEPGLLLARQSPAGWEVLLPGDPGWDETLAALPENALPLEQQPAPDGSSPDEAAIQAPLTGYYLPYAAGTARWMEGSISHFQSIPELGYPSCTAEFCRYAYDFTDLWHFPLLAAKEGSVYASRDSCPDGSPSCTNYIVLRNTAEGTFQIYLHLANGTIPDKLTPGTWVQRGQYIGDSDDTGYSTSQHVHFMVTTSVWMGNSGYYWGRSVDVRFADVAINNGIPRNCYEVTRFPIYDGATECLGDKSDPRNPANDWYVSGNVGAFPPTGTLTRPAAGAAVLAGPNPLMDVTANASDDVRVKAVQLLVKTGGQWVEVGPQVTSPVTAGVYDWDATLCEAGPFHGAVEVALRVWDHEGNVADALNPRTIQVDHACPPPSSQLTAAEVFDSTAVRLTWQASEAGAGLGSFAWQWRTQPGTWNDANIITAAADQRSAWFGGQPGGSYAFRLRALDDNGQPEPWPAGDAAEVSAVVPAACVADGAEPDNTPAQARLLAPGATAQGNLCPAGDPDWLRFEIVTPGAYIVRGSSLGGGAALKLSVYDSQGVTLLASGAAAGVGRSAALRFDPPSAGSYTLKVEPLTPGLQGTQALYAVAVEPARAFLPLMAR